MAHVKRLDKKLRYLMYIMTNVASRTKGMGLKLMKFHAIVHLFHDILQYGVPKEVDTGSNESHHKPVKAAAKNTQKNESTFTFQTAQRLDELKLIAYAMSEIRGFQLWEYHEKVQRFGTPLQGINPADTHKMGQGISALEVSDSEASEGSHLGDDVKQAANVPTFTYGSRILVSWDEEKDEPTYKLLTRSKSKKKHSWDKAVVQFLYELQCKVMGSGDNAQLTIYTEHKRGGQIFRGHPNYRGGGPWKDWVKVDWGDRELPAQIWCFVVVDGFQHGQKIQHGGIRLRNGIYGVTESCMFNTDDNEVGLSDLFVPLDKEMLEDPNGNSIGRTFFLADVEAFTEPLVVVPDIGGPSNRYFLLHDRPTWVKRFTQWLETPHELTDLEKERREEEAERSES